MITLATILLLQCIAGYWRTSCRRKNIIILYYYIVTFSFVQSAPRCIFAEKKCITFSVTLHLCDRRRRRRRRWRANDGAILFSSCASYLYFIRIIRVSLHFVSDEGEKGVVYVEKNPVVAPGRDADDLPRRGRLHDTIIIIYNIYIITLLYHYGVVVVVFVVVD